MSFQIDRTGESFHHPKFGSGCIIGISPKRTTSGNVLHFYRFDNTQNVIEVPYSNLKKGHYRDVEAPVVCGVGISRKGASKSPFYKTWSHMLERCYNSNFKAYPRYGGRGVTVCDRWHRFENFEKDCLNIEGVQNFLRKPSLYSLDKDEKGDGMIYDLKSCKFSSQKRQGIFTSKECNLLAIDLKTNAEILFYSVHDCAKSLGVQNANIYKVLNGERKSSMGYTFKRLENSFLKLR